jgi:hypothetical protein
MCATAVLATMAVTSQYGLPPTDIENAPARLMLWGSASVLHPSGVIETGPPEAHALRGTVAPCAIGVPDGFAAGRAVRPTILPVWIAGSAPSNMQNALGPDAETSLRAEPWTFGRCSAFGTGMGWPSSSESRIRAAAIGPCGATPGTKTHAWTVRHERRLALDADLGRCDPGSPAFTHLAIVEPVEAGASAEAGNA